MTHTISNIRFNPIKLTGKTIDLGAIWKHRIDICVIGAVIVLAVYCLCGFSHEEIQQFIGG